MKTEPKFSFIIPTVGRLSLRRVLSGLVPQLGPEDEVLVVADGPQPAAAEIVGAFGDYRVKPFEHGPTHAWGNAQRNFGISRASGTHLAFMDDDDQYLPSAVAAMRAAAVEEPDSVLLFRMVHEGRILWARRGVIEIGNVGTHMILAPNVPGKIPGWGPSKDAPDGYAADFVFIRDLAALWPVSWRREVVAELEVHSRPSSSPPLEAGPRIVRVAHQKC